MVSRFTLDSATEFLFGSNARSLSAGLPYPSYHLSTQTSNSSTHPANVFAHAFSEALTNIAVRSRRGTNWPLAEFWTDKTEKHMTIIHDFIDPILKEAVAKKRNATASGEKTGEVGLRDDREVLDGETLLDHLVNYTEGRYFS